MNKIKDKLCRVCGEQFTPYNSLQIVCKTRCAMKLVKNKKLNEKQKLRKLAGKDSDALRRKSDALFQEVGKKLHPRSILSGEPTEVIHHRIKKSESNYLRYYLPNGVPLTNTEHDAIHSRGKSIELDIDAIMGEEWCNDLREKRKNICKLSEAYLEETIQKLEDIKREIEEA